MKLTDQLLLLCNHPVDQRRLSLRISQEFRTLQRLTPLQMIVPLQSALTVLLPSNSCLQNNHSPFPQDTPTIASMCGFLRIMKVVVD